MLRDSLGAAQVPWEVEKPTNRCSLTGRSFEEGEEFCSALFEVEGSFRRVDYSPEAWSGPPEGCFCHFRTRVPVRKKQQKLLVDDAALVSFFLRLGDEQELVRVQFRFVLALILMRKRRLKYEASEIEAGVERWRMTLLPERSEHHVTNPRMGDEEIAGVSRELTAILQSPELLGDMAELAGEGAAPRDSTDSADD
jgi:hypothetical protein